MQCGVGQFTRLLGETVEKIEPGSCTTLTLTRSEGSFADIWRAVGSAQSVVCNFPIVAWKRVMFAPLLAMAMARLRRRKIVLIQHEWAGLHWLRRITYMPAFCSPIPSSCSRRWCGANSPRIPWWAGPRKNACWPRCRRT